MFLKKRIIATAAVIAMAAAAVYGSTQEMSQTQESGSGLQLFRGKETIYCWYSDEALSGYINAAAVSFGEQNNGVRVIPVLTSDSEYLEAINQETLHSDQIPDIYLLSSDSLEKAYLAGLASKVPDTVGICNTDHFSQAALSAVTYDQKLIGYPVYFDMEDNSTLGSDFGAIAQTFCSTVQNAGYAVGVYANLNWWNKYLTDTRFEQWHRWVAQYNIQCDYTGTYAMWQYSSKELVD